MATSVASTAIVLADQAPAEPTRITSPKSHELVHCTMIVCDEIPRERQNSVLNPYRKVATAIEAAVLAIGLGTTISGPRVRRSPGAHMAKSRAS